MQEVLSVPELIGALWGAATFACAALGWLGVRWALARMRGAAAGG